MIKTNRYGGGRGRQDPDLGPRGVHSLALGRHRMIKGTESGDARANSE